ncbi:hypothetical protein LXL04_013067 [Taraxacum kok-saghyz]
MDLLIAMVYVKSNESLFAVKKDLIKEVISFWMFHFIRNCVENEQVEVEYIPGEEQNADILTKPLARTKFKEMRSLIGIEDVSRRT